MTAYSAIADSEKDPESPFTTTLATKYRDNPIAIAEGASGAPPISGKGFINKQWRSRTLETGTTYTLPADVDQIYVFVLGAGGGSELPNQGNDGAGGCGYSEKYYSAPAASYTYAIGAGGTSSGTDGGTTSFDVMSVTGSGGSDSTATNVGGVGSGGTFNATGGNGGNGLTASYNGGGGGAGGRSGNGGNGGNGLGGAYGGGGGGTGGNNASGQTGGIAATTLAGGVITLPDWIGIVDTDFLAGSDGISGSQAEGGNGATGYQYGINGVVNGIAANIGASQGGLGGGLNRAGNDGSVLILEVLK